MSTALSIKGKTQANDAVTSTINYVNPNATNAQLQSLASAMNALTTNTIVDVTRIDKNSLTGAVTKLPRNAYLTLNNSSDPITSIAGSTISRDASSPTIINVYYDDNESEYEELWLAHGTNNIDYTISWNSRGTTAGLGNIYIANTENEASADELKIYIPEDSTYQSATLTLTITAE